MNPLESTLRQSLADLRDLEQQFALIGGLAVAARAEPRFTRDIDLAVAVSNDASAEFLVADMLARGYATVALVEQEVTHRLATVRLQPPEQSQVGCVVDLLFASSGIEPEIVAAAQELEILPGLTVPVATLGHLLVLKCLARDDQNRPQDAVDLRSLVLAARAGDVAQANDAALLVVHRGFHRGRPLRAELNRLVAQYRPDLVSRRVP